MSQQTRVIEIPPSGPAAAIFDTGQELEPPAGPTPYILEWGAGGLTGADAADRVLHATAQGAGTLLAMNTRENEGVGQRYMLVAGTFNLMLACLRGVQPNSTDTVWTYTVRVNEEDTDLTDSYNVRDVDNLPEFNVTEGISVHVDQGDRVSIKVRTDVSLTTVSAPYVALRFIPD